MVTPDLVRYIATRLSQGASLTEIKPELVKQGWSQQDIIDAYQITQGKPSGDTRGSRGTTGHLGEVHGWFFRAGFASIFLINGIVAFLAPEGFIGLAAGTFPATVTGHPEWYVYFAGANDLLLALLILSGKWSRIIFAWASLWLMAVTMVKVLDLLKDVSFSDIIGALPFL